VERQVQAYHRLQAAVAVEVEGLLVGLVELEIKQTILLRPDKEQVLLLLAVQAAAVAAVKETTHLLTVLGEMAAKVDQDFLECFI
jgi:hypothetical protein